MGDRANVFIHDGDEPGVWLYTHWGGESLSSKVKRALARRVRWDDAPYLARIIFDSMTQDSTGDETGNGISAMMCDNEHPIIDVDTAAQTVSLAKEPPKGEQLRPGPAFKTRTFDEYLTK